MKKLLFTILGVILFSVVAVTATSQAAPVESPSPEETPPPDWYIDKVADISYTHEGGAAGSGFHAEYSPATWPDDNGEAEAVLYRFTRECPSGDADVIARGQWHDGSSFLNPAWNLDQGQCGVSREGYWIVNGGESEVDTESQFSTLFPEFSGGQDGYSGSNPWGGYRVFTEGWHDNSGVVGHLEVWYVSYGTDYECEDLTDENTEVTQAATLEGTDEVGHLHEMVLDQQYLIYTSEGPWNDGTSDSYSVAIRFQDEGVWGDWTALSSYEGDDLCSTAWVGENQTAVTFTADETMDQLQIRVNDTDGEFEDNSGTINYNLNNGTESGYGACGDYYTVGSLKDSGTVLGTYSGGDWEVATSTKFTHHVPYALKILDPWKDNGVDSLDTQVKPLYSGTWNNDEVLGYDTCVVEDETTKTVYFNSPSDWTGGVFDSVYLDVRPNDGDSNYGNNSDDFTFEFYEADYTAPESSCAARYDRGTYIESPALHSSASNGVKLPYTANGFTVGNVYVLENVDSANAYYTINGEQYRTFEISTDQDTWMEMEVFADCVNPLDSFRNEYYFVAEQEYYYFRTEQGIPYFNDDVEGSLALNLYGGIDKGYDDGEDCASIFSTNQLVYKSSVSSSDSTGESIPYVFDPGEDYAIYISDPAYTGSSGLDDYDFDIRRTTVGGDSVDFTYYGQWPGGLCDQTDPTDPDRRLSLYFEGQDGQYEIRATGPHGENSGNLNYAIYTTSRDVAPANDDCELRDYGDVSYWYPVVEQDVAANDNHPDDPGNVFADELPSDARYKVEVSAGPAGGAYTSQNTYGGTNPTYQLEISTDNGANWTLLEDFLSCTVDVGDYIRGYFSNPSEDLGPFRVRVYDPTGEYLDNLGSLNFKLYSDQNYDVPGEYNYDPDAIPAGSGYGCTAKCVRPGSWLEVAAWVEYGRCRFTRYISWCPWHTDKFLSYGKMFYSVEPFGTILETIDTATAIKRTVESYEWTDEGGGGSATTVQAPRHFVLAPGEGGGADIPLVGEDTIWGSGEIDLTPGASSYSTECNNLLAQSLGERLSTPLCFTFNVVDQLGLKTWFQWIWDMSMIVGLLFYFGSNWVDLLQ